MTPVGLQSGGGAFFERKGGRKPFEREELQRTKRLFGDRRRDLSDAGSQNQKRWLTTTNEELLTYNPTTCRYHIGEHRHVSPAERGIGSLVLFCQSGGAGIIRRGFWQRVRDRL